MTIAVVESTRADGGGPEDALCVCVCVCGGGGGGGGEGDEERNVRCGKVKENGDECRPEDATA
jgi:hypothetical protein